MNQSNRHAGFNSKSTLAVFVVSIAILFLVNLVILNSPSGDIPEGTCTTTVPSRINVSNVSIFVNFKNTTIEHKENVTCTLNAARAVTVFDIMNASFRIAYNSFPNGYLISKINDAGQSGWTFIIDGKAPSIACNKQPVCNNSVIRWNEA
jgi:hypothetical protein